MGLLLGRSACVPDRPAGGPSQPSAGGRGPAPGAPAGTTVDRLAVDFSLPGQAGYGLIAWLVLHTGWHAWLGLPENP